jgi:lysophospholipase L1-like esterase
VGAYAEGMAERTLLCFGDSNTWGFEPGTMARYPRHVRWPGVVAERLGQGWHVIEAGLNGRTTVFEDPLDDLAGVRHLGPVLSSAAPVDVVVIALGTNDLKTRMGASAFEIAEGAGVLVDRVLASDAGPDARAPAVLLVAPPPIGGLGGWAARDPLAYEGFEQGWRYARERSLDFANQHARVARVRGVAFLDAGTHVVSSEIDGIHWEPEAHAAFARAVAAAVRTLVS